MKKLITLISTSFLIFNLAPAIKNVEINTKVNSTNLKVENNPLAPKAIKTNIKLTGIFVQRVTKDGILYAGTATGLYRSTDGINFIKIYSVKNTIQDIFINDDNGVIWVATYDVMVKFGSALYKSENGIDFNKTTNLFDNQYISAVIGFNGKVYVGSNFGLYVSENGINFEKIDQVQGTVNDFVITYFPGDQTYKTLYLGGSYGIYELNDEHEFVDDPDIKKDVNVVTADQDGNIYFAEGNQLFKETNAMSVKHITQFNGNIDSILISNKIIYLGTNSPGALYQSTDGTTFNKVLDTNRSDIRGLTVDNKGVIFLGDYQNGLVALNLPYKLVNLHGAEFDSNTNSFVFKDEKVIDLNPEFLDAATLDDTSISVASKGINLTTKQHTLVLTLKYQYRNYADLFGGTKGNKVITYNLTA